MLLHKLVLRLLVADAPRLRGPGLKVLVVCLLCSFIYYVAFCCLLVVIVVQFIVFIGVGLKVLVVGLLLEALLEHLERLVVVVFMFCLFPASEPAFLRRD